VDTVTYSVSDGFGGTATAQLSITVQAYQDVVVNNKSKGGSMTIWLVLGLSGAVLLRRRRMVGLTAALLLTVSPFSQSADWYVQGGLGQSKADVSSTQLAAQLPTGVLTARDDSDRSFSLNLGYQLHPRVALEVGYLDLGEGSASINSESLTPAQYHALVKAVSPVLVDGITATLRVQLWQDEQWQLEIPLGVLRWDSSIESQMGSSVLKTDLDGTDWHYGLQLNYRIAEHWQLGLSYQQFNLQPNDVKNWQLSARYHF
jgi:hypothetical protein